MRVLLDHCVPRPLARLLSGHQVRTAREMGWDDLGNGKLLASAASAFDVLVTVDQNLMHQQNAGELPIAVVVMVSRDIRLDVLELLVPEVLSVLDQGMTRRVYVVPDI